MQPLPPAGRESDGFRVHRTAEDVQRLHALPQLRVDLRFELADPLRNELRQRVLDTAHASFVAVSENMSGSCPAPFGNCQAPSARSSIHGNIGHAT